MRIVLFSDSHNNFGALQRVVQAQPEADLFLHLGDGWRELDELRRTYPDKVIRYVRGNCDWGAGGPLEDMLVAQDKRLFYTHGHRYGAKDGLARLKEAALALRSDIVAFGHTHVPLCRVEDGVHFINPGSVSLPRRGRASYGIVDLPPGGGVVMATVEL